MNLKEVEKAIIEGTIKNITSNITSIGSERFFGFSALTTVNIPNATSIGESAFSNCTALANVSFPNATSIGSSAFQGCSALTSASFPNATSIGGNAFSNCSNLDVHLYPGVLAIKYQGSVGISTYRPPKAIYLHYTEADEVLFSPADAIGKGSSKGTLTYNIYTDNTIIKDGVLSKADQYTIVNVKHLDGRNW